MRSELNRRSFLASMAAAGCPQFTDSRLARAGGTYVDSRRVLLWECTRKEIREALESGRLKAAIVPTGSTEQHNEHLAMVQDTASAVLVAQQSALRLYPQVIVSTPVPVGISPYWMERKGTLTLKQETFLAFVFDICESLKSHGLKNILILNGHGGNDKPTKAQLPDWRRRLGVKLDACSYWEGYTRDNAAAYMQSGMELIPGHSAEFETSFALAAFPQRVHRDGVDYASVKLNLKDPKDAEQDRKYYQDSLLATAAKGEALIGIAVDWVCEKLQRMMATP